MSGDAVIPERMETCVRQSAHAAMLFGELGVALGRDGVQPAALVIGVAAYLGCLVATTAAPEMPDALEIQIARWRTHQARLLELSNPRVIDQGGQWTAPGVPFFGEVHLSISEMIDVIRVQAAELAEQRALTRTGPIGAASVSGAYAEAMLRHGKLAP
ncbi:MAG: hypothetical protein ACYCZB_18195 [Acidiphilium sp.]